MNNIKKIILTAILSLFFLTASSQEFRLGNSYLPISCSIELFDSIWAKEYPQYTLIKWRYGLDEIRDAQINSVLSYRFVFKEYKGKSYLAKAIVDKTVPSIEIAKAEIKAARKVINDSYTYIQTRKSKNDIGLHDYYYQYFNNSLITFDLNSYKDKYGFIHCCSVNEYPMPYTPKGQK